MSPPVESTESVEDESSETTEEEEESGTTGDVMSDHEWMLPHNLLKSEGEVTPPKIPKG